MGSRSQTWIFFKNTMALTPEPIFTSLYMNFSCVLPEEKEPGFQMTPYRLVVGNTRMDLWNTRCCLTKCSVWFLVVWTCLGMYERRNLLAKFFKSVKILVKSKEKCLVFKLVNPGTWIGQQGGVGSHLLSSVDLPELEPLTSHLSFKATS